MANNVATAAHVPRSTALASAQSLQHQRGQVVVAEHAAEASSTAQHVDKHSGMPGAAVEVRITAKHHHQQFDSPLAETAALKTASKTTVLSTLTF
jgi:hypothetical protein